MSGRNHGETACSRRQFLGSSAKRTAGVAAGMVGLSAAAREDSNRVLEIGIIGLRGQGRKLARQLVSTEQARVRIVCDVDDGILTKAVRELTEIQGIPPQRTGDHAVLLADPRIDAVVIATPDHWHERLVRDCCAANRDIYLETPGGHSLLQSMKIAQLAERSDRLIHLGMPHRGRQHFAAAAELLNSGAIGRIGQIRAWSTSQSRQSPANENSELPAGVDYDRWLGSVPPRHFDPSAFHHFWKWNWEFGSGELGLWGVQMLDVARMLLPLELPERITAMGTSLTPDAGHRPPETMQVLYQYPECLLSWEHRRWTQYGNEGRSNGVAFYGETGALIIDHGGWKVYHGSEQHGQDAQPDSAVDVLNFIQAIRTRTPSAADIRETLTSLQLAHLGNLACRSGLVLDCRNELAAILDSHDLMDGTFDA